MALRIGPNILCLQLPGDYRAAVMTSRFPFCGARSERLVLRAWGAECGAVKPHHVKVQAFRVNRMAANLAGHGTDRVGNRLL